MQEFEKLLNTNIPCAETLTDCLMFLYQHNRQISLGEILPWFCPTYHSQIEQWWNDAVTSGTPVQAVVVSSMDNKPEITAEVFQHLIDFNTRLHEIEGLIHVLRIKNMNARKQLIKIKTKEYFE